MLSGLEPGAALWGEGYHGGVISISRRGTVAVLCREGGGLLMSRVGPSFTGGGMVSTEAPLSAQVWCCE